MYELFSLIKEKSGGQNKESLKYVSWECDFAECCEEIRQFYLGQKDCIVPILKETDKGYGIEISKALKVIVVNDTEMFMEIVRKMLP